MARVLLLVSLVAASACGDAAGAVCAKEAQCFESDCKYTDDACAALADGVEASCNAKYDALREATETGDSSQCDQCLDAADALYDCLADVESCNAFEDATRQGGDCEDQAADYNQECGDVEEDCWD